MVNVKGLRNPTLLKPPDFRLSGICTGTFGTRKNEVIFGISGGVGVWKSLGMREVAKALGFAASGMFLAQLTYKALGYHGGVSMNPLYPTYKGLGSKQLLTVSDYEFL